MSFIIMPKSCSDGIFAGSIKATSQLISPIIFLLITNHFQMRDDDSPDSPLQSEQ